MRTIPTEVLLKLQKNIMSMSTDAAPQMKVVATQTTMNTLLSEVIHKDVPANYGDVAIRQLPGESEPSLAYALCVDTGGTAALYERKLPALRDKPWVQLWTLGQASEVALEFDGTWRMNDEHQWHFLETEATPYVFFVRSGTLYVQKWQDSSTRTTIASGGVGEISVCRGWQSADDPTLDQGMVIGYLREGKVYYRALCLQPGGEQIWETEREVTGLGAGNTSLNVFRTNDFRIGFVCENAGNIKYVLSTRTYAGQSVVPETVTAQLMPCVIGYIKMKYWDGYTRENANCTIPAKGCYIGLTKQPEPIVILSLARIGLTEYEITFDHDLIEGLDLTGFVNLTPSVAVPPKVLSVTVINAKMKITAATSVTSSQPVTLQFFAGGNLRYLAPDGTCYLVAPFTAEFPAEAVYMDDGRVSFSLSAQLGYIAVRYIDAESEAEHVTAATGPCVIVATQVGDIPI